MANTSSAKKRVRQNETRRQHNASLRSKFRTFVKKVLYALQEQDLEKAKIAYAEAVPVIDGMVNKGIIHKNKAARHKSRLNKKIKLLGENK
ncbi:MAG: 30S ribosomal protein S20 [Legionellales bacterium]|mgnify:CR=1 FL=1|nr:30S ribosomal protein S20 [Legionellales bacterium]